MTYSIIQLIVISAVAGLLLFLEKIIANRVQKSSLNIWGKAALHSLRKPFHFFIGFTLLAFALRILQQMFIQDEMVKELSFTIYKAGVLFLFMWAVFRFINKFEHLSRFTRNNKYNATRISQLLRVTFSVIAGLCFLQLLHIPLSGLLAFGGVGGIAVGFAAKDLFANFFGGFMIFLDQPFQVGDVIRSPNQDIEGTVEHIGWRLTQIRISNKSLIFVPNTLFSTFILENATQTTHRQIKTKLILSFVEESKAQKIISEIEKCIQAHSGIDPDVASFANLIGFSPYGLEILIQAYTETIDQIAYQAIQQEIFLQILTIVASHGAHLARAGHFIPFE